MAGGARPGSGPKPGQNTIKSGALQAAIENAFGKSYDLVIAEFGAELFKKFNANGDPKHFLSFMKIYAPYLIEAPVQVIEERKQLTDLTSDELKEMLKAKMQAPKKEQE